MDIKSLIHYKDVKVGKNAIAYEEWSERVKRNGNFELIDLFYKVRNNGRKEAVLKIKHLNCNNIFYKQGNNLNVQKNCPICIKLMSVSVSHAILAMVLKENFVDVELEYDIGFKDGKSLYDIYLPNFKGKETLIEMQSKYHDTKAQKQIDKYKKEYAIGKGYNYIAIDHRDFSVNDIISFFIPNYKLDITKYEKRLSEFHITSFDISKAQKLLNEGRTIEFISKELDVSTNILHNYVANGVLYLTEFHRDFVFNKLKIVQLDIYGEFIKEFNSEYQLKEELGFRYIYARDNGTNYEKGFFLISKEKWEKKSYKIVDWNFIKNKKILDTKTGIKYESIYDMLTKMPHISGLRMKKIHEKIINKERFKII